MSSVLEKKKSKIYGHGIFAKKPHAAKALRKARMLLLLAKEGKKF